MYICHLSLHSSVLHCAAVLYCAVLLCCTAEAPWIAAISGSTISPLAFTPDVLYVTGKNGLLSLQMSQGGRVTGWLSWWLGGLLSLQMSQNGRLGGWVAC